MRTRFTIGYGKAGDLLYERNQHYPATLSEPVNRYYCPTDILNLPGNPDLSKSSLTPRGPKITATITNTPIPIRTTLPISPSAPIMALLLR